MAVSWDNLIPIEDKQKQQEGSAVSWDALTPVNEGVSQSALQYGSAEYNNYAAKNGEIYQAPSALSKIADALRGVAQTPFKAYSQGEKNVEAAELNAKEIFHSITPEEKKRMNALESAKRPDFGVPKIKYADENITNLPERVGNHIKKGYAESFENLPSSVEALKAGGVGSAVGGGVGAVGGALWGLSKGNPVGGTLDGFKAGVRLGGGAGAARKSFELEAGFARQELKNMRDKNGQPLPEDLVNNASIGVGIANAGLETIGLIAELNTFPGMDKVFKQAKKDFLKKVVEDEGLRNQLLAAGKNLIKSTATEMATESVQQVSNIVAEEYSKAVAGNYDDKLFEDGKINQGALKRHVSEVIQAGVSAIGPSIIIGGVGTSMTATNILVKNGMDAVQAKKLAEGMSVDERAELINNNLDTLDKVAENHINEVEAQDIEKNFFDKTIEAYKDADGNVSAEKENQVFSASKLLGAFSKKFGSDKEAMKTWVDKIMTTNKPVDELQGGIDVNTNNEIAGEFKVGDIVHDKSDDAIYEVSGLDKEGSPIFKNTETKAYRYNFPDENVLEKYAPDESQFIKPVEFVYDAKAQKAVNAENYVYSRPEFVEAYNNYIKNPNETNQENYEDVSGALYEQFSKIEKDLKAGKTVEELPTESVQNVLFQKKASKQLPTVEQYNNPKEDLSLPALNPADLKLIGKEAKPVVLKKNIIEKNKQSHPEISTEEYNNILLNGLYNPDVILKTNPKKPNYYNFIYKDKATNNQVLIELNENKDNFEVVNFYNLSDKSLARKVQAAKRVSAEGGQVLMTERNNSQGAAALSALDVNSVNSLNDNGQNVNPQGQVLYQEKGTSGKYDNIIDLIKKDLDDKWNKLSLLENKKERWENSESIIKKEKLKELNQEQKEIRKEIKQLDKKLYKLEDENTSQTYYQEKGVNDTEDVWDEIKSLSDVHKDVKTKRKEKELEYLGYFQGNQDKNIIGIMKDANESTLVHEMGHLFLQGLNEFAQSDKVSQEALAEVNEWLGYEGGGYTIAQQEKFAKGFEAYLYKGQAPTNTLREVFENFKEWLKDIYSHITQIADFSDEELNKIQSVFDNLFSEKTEKQKQVDALVEKTKFVGLEKLSDTEIRHKEAAYSILSVALGKSSKWLKTILESESENAKILKQKEKIELSLEHVDDKISGSDGFLPEWSEFFANPSQWSQENDYQLAQAAYDTIVNKSYKQRLDQVGFLDRTEQQYAYLLNQFKNSADRDVPLAAFFEWVSNVEDEFQEIYNDKFEKDVKYIERFEKMDKFEQAKETILNAYNEVKYSSGSVERYQEIVKAAMKSIKFLTPADQARLTENIMNMSETGFLESQIDNLLDVAKTMDDINYKKRLMDEIHKELQGTKNIKRSNKTVGKYDYTTNKVFERMREVEAMSVEKANEIRLEIGEHQEENGLSFEDKIVNAFVNYKANGLTFTSTEAAKAMYDDIVKMKIAGNEAKSEQDFSAKLNLSSDIVEVVKILDAQQKDASWVKNKYLKTFVNWESALNALFNNKIMNKYSLLAPERNSKVFAWEKKKKFAESAAKIYGKSVENFDVPIVENLKQKFEFHENVEDIENPGAYRKVPKTMNKMELILAYMWDKNEVLHERLLRQFGDKEADGTFSDLELERMFNELSDKDKQLGDLMMHTVNSIYPKTNEAFIKKYGIDLPRVENYFPSKVERISEVDLLTDFAMKSTDPSAIKQRSQSVGLKQDFGNPVLMMFQHIDSMSKFIHMTETLDMQNKIFKNKTLQKVIENKYDKAVYQEFLRQLTANTYKQQMQNYCEDQKITDAVISNYLISNISFKPSIAIKQGITAMNYSELMPAGQWATGFAKAIKDAKGTIELMNKIPYLKARFETGGQNEFLENEITNSLFVKTGKIKDALTLNIRSGDIFAIAFGGRPYLEYLMKDKKMSEQDAIEEFLNHTQRTMQASETSTLANYQIKARNERGIASLVTAYRNAQAQYIRKSADAIISYSKGEMTGQQMAKTLFIYMYLNPFLYRSATSLSAITLLTTGNGDDLRDDAILSLFDFNADAHAIWGEIYQFVASVLYKKAVEAATGEEPDYMDFATKLPLVGDIQDQILKIAKDDVSFEDYFKFGGYMTQVGFGIPVNSVANSIGGLGDVAQGNFLKGALKVGGWSDRRAAEAAGEEE